MNDGIDPLLCSLTYTTVDDIAAKISLLGQGALMAKIDVESAYRLLPVHPQDRIFQAIRWEGDTFIDLVLPFGLRSAAKIFNTVADALNWHLRRAGVEHIDHYLDDFIMLGSPGSSQCDDALAVVERECAALGVPLASHKREGPTTCITFLGILIETVAGQLRLPQEKLTRLQELLHQWEGRKSCARRELESLIGEASWALPITH